MQTIQTMTLCVALALGQGVLANTGHPFDFTSLQVPVKGYYAIGHHAQLLLKEPAPSAEQYPVQMINTRFFSGMARHNLQTIPVQTLSISDQLHSNKGYYCLLHH